MKPEEVAAELKEHLKQFLENDVKLSLVKKKMGVGHQRMEYMGLRMHVPRVRMEEVPIPEFNTKENLFSWISLQVKRFKETN